MPFAVESFDHLMYISVHDGNNCWGWDVQVDPQLFGCVTIKEDQNGRISVFPSNPEPQWMQFNTNLTFPSGLVKVHQRPDNVVVYLAKVGGFDMFSLKNMLFPTGVWRENGTLCMQSSFEKLLLSLYRTVDLLLATKYEWARAQRGNVIPPNAVKTIFLNNGNPEEQYLGRVGGELVSGITIADGRLDYFVPVKGLKSTSGEVLLLTVDPSA